MELEDPAAAGTLLEYLASDDRHVRHFAGEALSDLAFRVRPQLVDPLVEALRSENHHVRSLAAGSLGWAGASAEQIRPALQDEVPRVRKNAALALGHVEGQDAVDALLSALADPEARVRRMAAYGLGRRRDPRLLEPLARLLADPDDGVRRTAALALGRLQDPRSASILIDGLRDSRLTPHCARALIRAGDPRAVDALVNVLPEVEREVLPTVVWALIQLGAQERLRAAGYAMECAIMEQRLADKAADLERRNAAWRQEFGTVTREELQARRQAQIQAWMLEYESS